MKYTSPGHIKHTLTAMLLLLAGMTATVSCSSNNDDDAPSQGSNSNQGITFSIPLSHGRLNKTRGLLPQRHRQQAHGRAQSR